MSDNDRIAKAFDDALKGHRRRRTKWEIASDALGELSEGDDLDGYERDAIGLVRDLLWRKGE